MRDFFRRGDRGQYEGGPADCGLESLPNLEVPERVAIVRTPQQQARRLALMRFEAVLLAGCGGFLVAATYLNSGGPSEPQAAGSGNDPALHNARTIPRPLAAAAGPLKEHPSIAAPVRVTATAPKATPMVQAQAPTLVQAPKANSIAPATIAAGGAPRTGQVRSEAPIAVLPSVQRQRQAKVAAPTYKVAPASPTRSVVPRAAVAAFADD